MKNLPEATYNDAEFMGCLLETGPLKGLYLTYWGTVRKWYQENYPERIKENSLHEDRFVSDYLKWMQDLGLTPGTRQKRVLADYLHAESMSAYKKGVLHE